MAKLEIPNAEIPVDGKTLHDIDYYAFGATDWTFQGDVPVIDGETLNWMFPKGFKLMWDKTNGNHTARKAQWLGYLEWQRCDQILMEQWDYEGLPDYLNKYIIEFLLLQHGTNALFRINGSDELYLQPYTIDKRDIYDNPIEIRIISNNETFNDKIIKEDDFVIINDTQDKINIFSKIIQPISEMNDVLRRMAKNLKVADPKALLLDTYGQDEHGNSPLKDVFEKISRSEESWHVANLSADDLETLTKWAQALNSKQIYIPMELRDRTTELIDNYSFWKNVLQQQLGLAVDYNMDKGERKITGEIATQQGMSRGILLHRFKIREFALKQANKKFGLDMKIKWNPMNENIFNPQVEDEETKQTREGTLNEMK